MGFGGGPQYNVRFDYTYPGIPGPGYGSNVPGAVYPAMAPAIEIPMQGPVHGPPAPPGLGSAAGSPVRGLIIAALIKMGNVIGKKLSVRKAVMIIRKMMRYLSIASIAATIGLTTMEIGQLVLADNMRKRRRMNPLNMHALTRAQRRLCSFENRVKKVVSMNRNSIVRRPRKRRCK